MGQFKCLLLTICQHRFVANRCCRFCNATKEGMELKLSDYALRTPESYDTIVTTVEAGPSLATVYGIKSRSELNSLDHYHVAGGIPSGAAHDTCERLGWDVLDFSVKYWVQQGYFTLLQMNDLIETISYSASDKVNRSLRMSSELGKFRVKQTASQAWCFFHLFPIIIGQKMMPHGIYLPCS